MPSYCVYVIELNRKVFNENARFRTANPQFNPVLECLYVGMTSKTPKERFEQHVSGHVNEKGHKLASKLVQKYGIFLRPSLYSHLDIVKTKKEALALEQKLTLELRRLGYAVWSN
jgi:hypothetical protein